MSVRDLQDLQTEGIADGSGTQGAEFLLADALGKGVLLVHHDKFNRWNPVCFARSTKGFAENSGGANFFFSRQRLETCPSYTWMQLHGCIGFNILAGFGGGRNAPFILFSPMPHEAGVWCRKTDPAARPEIPRDDGLLHRRQLLFEVATLQVQHAVLQSVAVVHPNGGLTSPGRQASG